MSFHFRAGLPILLVASACATPSPSAVSPTSFEASDTIETRRLFEENIDAIHKRDRARYLVTYIHSPTLARNGPTGLQLGYEDLRG